MENASELLMTTGTMALCPDCDGERLFVMVEEGEHCCTACDAAVFGLDLGGAAARSGHRAAARLSRPA